MEILAIIGVLALGATLLLFRKGGAYNPTQPPDDLDEPVVEPETPEPLPTPPVATEAPEVIPESVTETSPPVVPVPAPTGTTIYPKATLLNFATAIRDFEGWFPPGSAGYPSGSRSFKNHNPGNVRYNPGGYLPRYGNVGKDKDGFAKFRDYATGWLYLLNMLRGQIHKRPNLTILQFISRYAPEEDNNQPVQYATFIARRLAVDKDKFLVKNLS